MANVKPKPRTTSLTGLFIVCQALCWNFLALDFLRRLTDPLAATPVFSLLVNIAIVGSLGTLFSLLAAFLMYGLEKLKRGISGPIFFLVFYTIALSFAKFRFVGEIDFIELKLRWTVCILSVLAMVPIGFAMRRNLSELRGLLAAGGSRLAWAMSLPFFLATLVFGAYRLLAPDPPPPDSRSTQPNVLLLTLDGLAATDMSCYGYERPTTPELEKWAREFIVFNSAHSASNATRMSIPSFLGRPFGTVKPGGRLTDKLADLGYEERVWISSSLSALYGIGGFSDAIVFYSFENTRFYPLLRRVFKRNDLTWLASLASEEWIYFWPYQVWGTAEYHKFWTREHHPAQLGLNLTREYLSQPRSKPAFAWVHLHQPHYPYLPEPPFKGRFDSGELLFPPLTGSVYTPGYQDEVTLLRRRYDEYVLQLDSQLGAFLQGLKDDGTLDQTIVVISSDHGESFQGGFVGHGGERLSEAELRIPLFIRYPGEDLSERVETFCSPLDIAPTILAKLGSQAAKDFPGEDLGPYVKDPKKRSSLPRLSISFQAYTRGVGEVAVYSGRFKIVFRKEDRDDIRVYDLVSDPEAKNNIVDRYREQARQVAESVNW